jgi:hypothetical protein
VGQRHLTVTIVSCNSQHQLATVECLSVTARSVTFHPAQPHEGEEGLLLEPALAVLGLEGIHDVANLCLVHFWRKRHEQAWLSQVTVIFRDLVLQDQVISKCIPGQFADQTMVLMRIFSAMSEDHVRRERA